MSTRRRLAAFVLALAVLAPLPAAAQGCLSRGDGRQLLEQGRVMPFPEAMRRAGIPADQVVDVELCASGGGYVYRVQVLQPGGAVRAMTIPAG